MKTENSDKMLLAGDKSSFSDRVYELLLANGFTCDRADTGREAQQLLFKNSYSTVILDLNLSNYSSIEVLKYIKLSKQKIKILLIVSDKKVFDDSGLETSQLVKLGVDDTVFPKNNPSKVLEKVLEMSHATSWKKIIPGGKAADSSELKMQDGMFTRIPIEDALLGNVAVFNHYIKLGANKYVKVVHQGEHFPVQLLENYAASGCEYLYFMTKDRVIYINYMNDLSQKLITSGKISSSKAFEQLHSTTEKYIEEVYTKGIKTDLVAEGKKICNNIYQLISKDKNLHSIFKSMEDQDPSTLSHSFLVTFFAIIICKNVDWMGPKGIDAIAMGCLLHDIGILGLPPGLRDKHQHEDLNIKDQQTYKTHPILGADMLRNIPSINEQVRQIIYQHHEYVNGTGYPNGLTDLKIYPLAKIVSLADGYTDFLVARKLSPRQTLRAFLLDRNEIVKYDANLLRALVNGMRETV